MTSMSTPTINRRQWCGLVAALCAPGFAANATEALWNMLPALGHFPDYLFTPESAQEVASRKHAIAPRQPYEASEKRSVSQVPAWDEITRALNAYRQQYVHEPRPALPAPAEPERKTPSQEEAEAVTRSVAQALQVIAEEGARMRDDTAMHLRPRAATASGEGLHQLRKQRFADLVAAGKMQPHEVPEHYR